MPEITGSSMALSSLPTLPIPPYGLDTFTDFERGLSFTTLHFKHFGGNREMALAWIGDVLVELAAAGIPASGPCDIVLTPDVAKSTKARVKWRCHLKVPTNHKVHPNIEAQNIEAQNIEAQNIEAQNIEAQNIEAQTETTQKDEDRVGG